MARTIESPGVQINEFDVSLNATLPVGTNIFVQGFAPQGPTDELLNVTTISEFEQIYGTPTNAAERYFYHTAKQVFNSPGNLLCTRLPYGLSGGEGYGNEYTALLYPVVAYGCTNLSTSSTTVTSVTAGGTIVQNVTTTILSGTVTSYSDTSAYAFGAPTLISLTEEQYNAWEAGQITWASPLSTGIYYSTVTTISAASGTVESTFDTGTVTQAASSYDTAGNAGMIVINKIKSANNQIHEGYYVAVRDNMNFDDVVDTNLLYNSISAVNYDNSGVWATVPATTIQKSLTGTEVGDSLSEDLDKSTMADFDSDENRDVLCIALFKFSSTVYTDLPGVALQSSVIENYSGSLDSTRMYAPNGTTQSMYLGTIVNEKSPRLEMMTNPNISKNGNNWNINNQRKKVTINSNLYATGLTLSNVGTNKNVGNLPDKLERSLRLAENRDQIPIDLVCEAGLGTIWASVGTSSTGTTLGNAAAEYNDESYLKGVLETDAAFDGGKYVGDPSDGTSSIISQQYNTIYELFAQFAGETRKDCLFIADPLKHIFVQGQLTTLANTARNFSQHIYWPLKNLFAAANSNYTCTYGNWVSLYDNNLGKFTWLPFSGFEANIMAKMDSALQPWFAPAGLNNGIVRGITDIAINPNQKQRDLLYRISVNPVVLPGDGYTVWGQKTLQRKPSAFDRINVRRLFLVLEKATNSIMRYFVFEPNTVFTTRVGNVLTPIFEVPKNNEGVYDYLIVCDDRNNTPAVIDANELVVDIYIKPVRTAEFILVNFYATRTDQDFNELI